ncbi:hypothetical protein J2Z62_000074 [Mycoplasmoides fastidiosum]|uniref:DUF4145 domain-containing protein n=1 Tax=Mycoplasmoides fastidiosum TaxID=92758 RepID=A0ABU0LY43_9BACT|nr:DUF4145 domain-containing protein [Mycoplasmoides fastidiosum]MDQ0513636.1 hypothetical protein [Mycoplasmoides fastidiosum]UUD37943.1 DUF4145 domain-containing protein [Mycoplasmoides fastidiosum]
MGNKNNKETNQDNPTKIKQTVLQAQTTEVNPNQSKLKQNQQAVTNPQPVQTVQNNATAANKQNKPAAQQSTKQPNQSKQPVAKKSTVTENKNSTPKPVQTNNQQPKDATVLQATSKTSHHPAQNKVEPVVVSQPQQIPTGLLTQLNQPQIHPATAIVNSVPVNSDEPSSLTSNLASKPNPQLGIKLKDKLDDSKEKLELPYYTQNNFVCPSCFKRRNQDWLSIEELVKLAQTSPQLQKSGWQEKLKTFNDNSLKLSYCKNCKRFAYWNIEYYDQFKKEFRQLHGGNEKAWDMEKFYKVCSNLQLVYPVRHLNVISQPNLDMDNLCINLFNEAAKVYAISPRSAAVLLRVIMEQMFQTICKNNTSIGVNLKAIEERLSDHFKENYLEQLHAVVDLLNNASHCKLKELPQQHVLLIHNTFEIINRLADELLTRPRMLNQIASNKKEVNS